MCVCPVCVVRQESVNNMKQRALKLSRSPERELWGNVLFLEDFSRIFSRNAAELPTAGLLRPPFLELRQIYKSRRNSDTER